MTEEESVSESLIESAVRVLFRVVFAFEPLAPTAITVIDESAVARFKEAGAIGEYKAKAKRLGKFHYRIEIDLDLTGMQAIHLLSNLFPKPIKQVQEVVP